LLSHFPQGRTALHTIQEADLGQQVKPVPANARILTVVRALSKAIQLAFTFSANGCFAVAALNRAC
jgi:hypothetical protein